MSGNGFHDLGRLDLELRLASANVNLRLESELKFVTTRKDANDGAEPRLLGHLLDGNGYHKPWVVKGHCYQLVVSLNVDAALELEDEAIAQQVAAQLKHSEARDVTSIETRPSDCQITTWVLSLEHDEQIRHSEKRVLHKLSPDLPYYDTKPPPGVAVAKIEIVHVNLLLTPTLNALPRIPVPSDIFDYDPEGEPDSDMLFSANGAVDETWSSLFSDNPDQLDFKDAETYFTAEQDNVDTSSVGTQKPYSQDPEVFAPQQRCPYPTPPSSQGRLEQSQSTVKPSTLHAQGMSAGDLLQAIEAGLRYATLKSPIRKVKSATVSSNESFRSLTSIAPALWVPDYHRLVSSRAVLIPTISHAIANVSSRASTNPGLGEKVQQLAHQQSRNDHQDGSNNAHVRVRESQDALSVQIWQGMTSSLSSTAIPRKLQPFSDVAESNDHADAHESMEDMLDETVNDQESCGSCDESDFEDLDEALSEFNDEVAGEFDDPSELGSMRSGWIGDLEDPPTDGWDFEDLLLHESEPDLLGEELEFDSVMICEVMDFSDGDNHGGNHPRAASWHNSTPTPASVTSEFEEIGTVGFDVEDLILEPGAFFMSAGVM